MLLEILGRYNAGNKASGGRDVSIFLKRGVMYFMDWVKSMACLKTFKTDQK